MNLALVEHADGVDTAAGPRVVYDVERNEAHFGAAHVEGRALVWELDWSDEGALLVATFPLDGPDWLVRCDRVDFPPGGVAHRHTHPGPGIRYLLCGSLRVETGGETHEYRPGEPWFESGPAPVLATASATEDTAFVRVMLVPREWRGKRTIRYVDPADAEKPKLQRATVFLEQPVRID